MTVKERLPSPKKRPFQTSVLLTFQHLFSLPNRNSFVGKRNKSEIVKAAEIMNRRDDDRVDVELPCRLIFPNIWPGSLEGYTANLHRNGVLVACELHPSREMPAVGEVASVHIELPPSTDFPPKFMACDTTLLRVDSLGQSKFQFALQIRKVDFADLSPASIHLMQLDSDSCDYLM